MTDFYFRHKKEIRRIAVFFLTAAVGLLLVAQIAAFAAAQIFNYAVEKQHMLKGTITAEKISADIAGYVLFKNLQWNDEANRPILFVPEVRMKVRPWDILRGKLRATAISDIKLKDASFALYFDIPFIEIAFPDFHKQRNFSGVFAETAVGFYQHAQVFCGNVE